MSAGSAFGLSLALALTMVARLAAAGMPDPAAWINPVVPQRADPHLLRHTDGSR